MVILKIIIPIGYSLFIGGSYGMVFKKKFGQSLIQAYCIQILLLLMSGMVFHNLYDGILVGGIASLLGWLYSWRSDKEYFAEHFRMIYRDMSVVAFLLLSGFVFTINYGKHYSQWDEFSHWGRFIEECCRLNQLYVTSPAQMAHKDYLPGVTLFEYLWCKLSLAYSEANAYRGIQMLFVAVVLAVANQAVSQKRKSINIARYLMSVLILMGVPLLFGCFNFYHSIYEDAILGMLMFYGIWVASCDEGSLKYKSMSLALALSVLILCKMTAIPFVLLIWLLFVWIEQKLGEITPLKKGILVFLPLFFSLLIWLTYTRYTSLFVENSGTQSYSGFTLELIIGVLTHNGHIAWQNAVEASYWKAVLMQGLIGGASFAFVSSVIFICLFYQIRRAHKEKVFQSEPDRIMIYWLAGSTILYAFMMCLLYDTSFSEYEARKLASFDRYMCTWLLVLVLVFVVRIFSNERRSNLTTYLVFLSFIVMAGNREQVLSGITADETEQYSGESKRINSVVADDESVLLIERGTNGKMAAKLGYYCIPRVVNYVSPGPAARDEDIWSTDLTPEELADLVCGYDYVYVIKVDTAFVDKYHELFPDITENMEEELYKVNRENGELISIQNQ